MKYLHKKRIFVQISGQFQYENPNEITFMKANDYISSFVNRRGNFYGIEFKAMVDFEPPMTYFTKDYKSKVEYFPKNETYDVTDVSRGVFIDSLKSLGSSLNFSIKLYQRKDGVWGLPKKLPNGKIYTGGMLQNILDGDVHFGNLKSTPFRSIKSLMSYQKQFI